MTEITVEHRVLGRIRHVAGHRLVRVVLGGIVDQDWLTELMAA